MAATRAIILTAGGFEDFELFFPYFRLQEEGIEVDVAGPSKEKISGVHGYQIEPTKTFDQINSAEYDLLVLPGGRAPATVRKEEKALRTARAFFDTNKPVAAICHGPQILASAGLLKGRKATCYSEVAPELREAGALYEDKEVVVDGNLVTSRHPKDLPAFMREVMRMIK